MKSAGAFLFILVAVLGLRGIFLGLERGAADETIVGSKTYRAEIVGQQGVIAAGRHFAAEAGMRMFTRGGNAVDAGVAATFAAAVTEISHFGLGGEVPILIHVSSRGETFVVNGQGTSPASIEAVRRVRRIPTNGPSAGTIPAVVDALAIALAEFGTLSLRDTLVPAIALADGFPWYEFLTRYLTPERARILHYPTGAAVYLAGPGQSIPAEGALFRQPNLAATLRALADEEQRHLALGRKAAIYAARDRFYRGDIGRRIAKAVQESGGLMTEADLADYRGAVESTTRRLFVTRHGSFEVHKTGFWGQGPVLLQALGILQGFDLERMGHNSTEYIHTVTEALKLALADRDMFYGDPAVVTVPSAGLLSETYASERRLMIDPLRANNERRPGEPWAHQAEKARARRAPPASRSAASESERAGEPSGSLDTTTVNVADARGNLFSASPSSAWFFGGVFIAGDTGVPLGNRMQAFVLDPDHPNGIAGKKRPRTTLSPTVVLRDGQPFLALSSPGADAQDQQALQVLLNVTVFNMRPQDAIEAPRFNTLHHQESLRDHRFRAGILQLEDRISPGVVDALRRLGHSVNVVGPFMVDSGMALVGFRAVHGTVFGAADVRRQRFVTGW